MALNHIFGRMALINKCNVKMTVDSYSKITILAEQKIRMVLVKITSDGSVPKPSPEPGFGGLRHDSGLGLTL